MPALEKIIKIATLFLVIISILLVSYQLINRYRNSSETGPIDPGVMSIEVNTTKPADFIYEKTGAGFSITIDQIRNGTGSKAVFATIEKKGGGIMKIKEGRKNSGYVYAGYLITITDIEENLVKFSIVREPESSAQ